MMADTNRLLLLIGSWPNKLIPHPRNTFISMTMATVRFEDILAWQKAYGFILQTYKALAAYPQDEKYGLCSQFQRAAVSIAANIAEGYKRIGKAYKLHFLNFAQGSLEECRCYLHLSGDLGYISTETYKSLYASLEETSKLLNGYCKGILSNSFKSTADE